MSEDALDRLKWLNQYVEDTFPFPLDSATGQDHRTSSLRYIMKMLILMKEGRTDDTIGKIMDLRCVSYRKAQEYFYNVFQRKELIEVSTGTWKWIGKTFKGGE